MHYKKDGSEDLRQYHPYNDLTGKRFGRLVVLGLDHVDTKVRESGRYDNIRWWKCQCDCGNTKLIQGKRLNGSHPSQSCGCIAKEKSSEFFRTHNPNGSHGLSSTRQYKIYQKMKERCYNPNNIGYHLYGGRGIRVCDEWRNDFKAFYDWSLENGYADDRSIDRIDENGNYCPENCRWADKYTQANNKRNNIVLTYNGETHTMPEWARILDLPYSVLANRRRKGKSVEEILDPVKHR